MQVKSFRLQEQCPHFLMSSKGYGFPQTPQINSSRQICIIILMHSCLLLLLKGFIERSAMKTIKWIQAGTVLINNIHTECSAFNICLHLYSKAKGVWKFVEFRMLEGCAHLTFMQDTGDHFLCMAAWSAISTHHIKVNTEERPLHPVWRTTKGDYGVFLGMF